MLIDANILLYARDVSSPFHRAAADWLEAALNASVRVGLPWQSLVAFLRISTHPRPYDRPLSPSAAREQVADWLAAPAAWIPTETEAHMAVLGELIGRYRLTGNHISDAHLAALAISHGVALVSADTDFARFRELTWINPVGR